MKKQIKIFSFNRDAFNYETACKNVNSWITISGIEVDSISFDNFREIVITVIYWHEKAL